MRKALWLALVGVVMMAGGCAGPMSIKTVSEVPVHLHRNGRLEAHYIAEYWRELIPFRAVQEQTWLVTARDGADDRESRDEGRWKPRYDLATNGHATGLAERIHTMMHRHPPLGSLRVISIDPVYIVRVNSPREWDGQLLNGLMAGGNWSPFGGEQSASPFITEYDLDYKIVEVLAHGDMRGTYGALCDMRGQPLRQFVGPAVDE